MKRLACLTSAVLACASASSFAQDLASFEKRVSTKTLPNGLTVIVCERPEAPVFSFFTHVDVGSDREVPGILGIAHMFEHMAFKGTDTIGTTDYAAEKLALEKVEQAYIAYDAERRKPVGREDAKVEELYKAWKVAMSDADRYVKTNEFLEIVQREGGVGLNAHTSAEETAYLYSLPVNRLELWAFLESERFLRPVMREFYKERDVVMEERRISESNPIRRMIEQFVATAFVAHPYGQPVLGWFSDLQTFSASDAMAFYERYYVPSNMVIAVVGDVKPEQVFPLVEKYFGRLPARPKPEPLRTVEPPQNAERQVVLREMAQPFYVEGYHRPNVLDPNDAVFDVISDILSNGRTSRLYRSLVRDRKIAAVSVGFSGFPGEKYPNLFIIYAITTPGHSPEEVRDAIRAEIERLKHEDVSEDELQMARTRAKAALIRGLGDNQGLARQLSYYQTIFGDWRELFHQVERIEKVRNEDVRRVAKATFVASNRTVGIIKSTPPAGAAIQ